MQTLILVGGGHAHLALLKQLEQGIPCGWRVQLVSPAGYQIYSGMLPGWIAGHYQLPECQIDLRQLCERGKIDFLLDKAVDIDAQRRCVMLASGLTLTYDLLSIDVGSESDIADLALAGNKLIPIRPIDDFVLRWAQMIEMLKQGQALSIAVVGGGAAGIELALGMQYAKNQQNLQLQIHLVCSSKGVLPGFADNVRGRIQAILDCSGMQLHQSRATGTTAGLQLENGKHISLDWIIAAPSVCAPAWLKSSSLALNEKGFIAVSEAQQSLSHRNVFAAGDICSTPIEHAKSGVHAVRAGPILAKNLLNVMQSEVAPAIAPAIYQPKKTTLYLIATGSQYAVASWGKLSAQGYWVWRWKRWIDRRFVAKYNHE